MLLNLREQGQTIEVLLSMTVAMGVCAQAIARDIELTKIAAPDLVAAFRQGGDDGVRRAPQEGAPRPRDDCGESPRRRDG
jgi:hypothetical protein